jgi:hypothetical protein
VLANVFEDGFSGAAILFYYGKKERYLLQAFS